MPNRSWASSTLTLVAVLSIAAGCDTGSDGSADNDFVTVYISAPQRGPSGADGRDVADGARLALTDAGGRAGELEVRAEYLDAAAGSTGWTPAQAAANARTATEDSTAIAYLGDFQSGASRASVPITNEAHMLQVSPASSAVDLVAPFAGTDEVPEVQASGERTFGRVIPSDDVQGEAAAAWAERLGAGRISTLSDGSPFGDSLVTAFEEALTNATVTRGGGDLFFFGGEPHRQPASLLQSFPGRVMVSDAQLIKGAVEAQPDGTLATSAALDPSHLPAPGREFVAAFEAEHRRQPGRYAAYGYEAMAVVLDAIERAGDEGADRDAVVDAFFETADRESVLGTYSIDEVGDTTLERLTGYRLEEGRLEPLAELSPP